MLRVLGSFVVALSVALAVTACAGADPDPSPSATALFATDEEAFAAAEATYRAYVDALNDFRNGGVSDPMAFLTGQAYESALETSQTLEAAGLQIVGPSEVLSFRADEVDRDRVVASVCVDSTTARVMDLEGIDRTPVEREVRSVLAVAFVHVDDALSIERSDLSDEKC